MPKYLIVVAENPSVATLVEAPNPKTALIKYAKHTGSEPEEYANLDEEGLQDLLRVAISEEPILEALDWT